MSENCKICLIDITVCLNYNKKRAYIFDLNHLKKELLNYGIEFNRNT